MKIMSAREAKNGFGLMIDTARAAPVLVQKHGRGVVVVVAVEEYERLKRLDCQRTSVDAVRD
ncbi:type II toxin-antitoxin system prevent-host-death family antitoxin [Acetobacter fallax]|uniref:Antitoxin n=1 Tax=Acetobacter fallax TaxID=1737473 RepID=A0ABX0KGI0_9PROT|nr:type II toxin-antitoxin system prevent-host-death family antitoxin [Acetobacter fallax]NHO34251.1 type II toxin-antitoxin system prevent-host-death family antitoxin [Acetobacter fallax]NHO37796.1 type II toxin-antitoxin system prevent-host-death family antitoxin [Acetobacter fallax]